MSDYQRNSGNSFSHITYMMDLSTMSAIDWNWFLHEMWDRNGNINPWHSADYLRLSHAVVSVFYRSRIFKCQATSNHMCYLTLKFARVILTSERRNHDQAHTHTHQIRTSGQTPNLLWYSLSLGLVHTIGEKLNRWLTIRMHYTHR